jgi:hypothetical protein
MCREVLVPWLPEVSHFSDLLRRAEESRLASARSRVSISNRSLKRLRCGSPSPKFSGLTGTDPEGASELGKEFISLLVGDISGKRWLAHSGIALKDLSGY